METIARRFIIPSGQNQFNQENVFNNAPIRRIAIAMNTNSAFTGHFQENPFHYRKFGLRELRIVRGGRIVVSIDTTNNCRAYVTTMKAMNFNEEIRALANDFFTDHYVLVFDLTSLQDVLAGRIKFKSAATVVGKKTLRKQLGGGKPKKRRIIRKRSPKISRRRRTRRDIFSKLK